MFKEILASIGFMKHSKTSVEYMEQASGKDDCRLCWDHLPAIHRCRTVAGRINPNGWCKRFATKSSWEGSHWE